MTVNRRNKYPQEDAIIGANLRRFRLKLDWSQTALAEKLGLTFQQIQKYENATNRISASTMYRMSKVMNVPIVDFFDGLDVEHGIPSALSKDEAAVLRLYNQISDVKLKRSLKAMLQSFAAQQTDVSEALPH
jgi:transcriptional regulator with XRE-family HTH domain